MELKDAHALVVDDDRFFQQLLKEQLLSGGVGMVSTVSSVKEAIGVFRDNAQKFDLLILDWLIGDSTGLEVLRTVRREDSPRRDIPVVMISGEALRERVQKGRDAGMHEFLTKPFSKKRLMDAVDRALNYPRPFVVFGDYAGPDRRFHRTDFEGEDRRTY